ncbi:hypothetical protein BDZ90DRAFT_233411 [Jaminaea rosea]|uniref:Autophagy protein 5 n=1 Tax=Jaminaea rosea TaxID=1569628 RepID=A0A316ULZ0_9BASI|nr:hypothetical protein BDZ90DRAFT_233411 [Jaminaea rosea]PWN26277.1 hypothetical protein BDZ90DRAFT_233411 [Jaminaea rosea]
MSSTSLRPSNVNSLAGTPSGSAVAGPSRLPSSSPSPAVNMDPSHLSERIFSAALPVVISIASDEVLPSSLSEGAPADLTYYTTLRRTGYLSLHLQEIKENLIDLVLPPSSSTYKPEDLWLSSGSTPLKWHWPIGLLYDLTTLNVCSPAKALTPCDPWRLTLHLRNPPHAKLPWPTIAPASSYSTSAVGIHDALVEATKQAYMSQLKEADFIRNGNTKKVNSLRKQELDAVWEALVAGEYEKWMGVVGRLLPAQGSWPDEGVGARPALAHLQSTTSSIPNRSSSLHPASSSTDDHLEGADDSAVPSASGPGTFSKSNSGAYTSLPGLKAIPVKIVLQGGTVIQEGVPPLVVLGGAGSNGGGQADGNGNGNGSNSATRSLTVGEALHVLLPALFPASSTPTIEPSQASGADPSSLGIDFSGFDSTEGKALPDPPAPPPPMAVPIVQGVRIPLESSMPWLCRVMSGGEGWLTIVVLLLPIGVS